MKLGAFLIALCLCCSGAVADTLTVVAQPLWTVHYIYFDGDSCEVQGISSSDTTFANSIINPAELQTCFYTLNFPTSLSRCTGYTVVMRTRNLTQRTTPWILVQEYPRAATDPPFEFPCEYHYWGQFAFPAECDSEQTCFSATPPEIHAYNAWSLHNEHPDAVRFVYGIEVADNDRLKILSLELLWETDSTGAAEEKPTVPLSFSLAQNFPNPFNAVTIIPFDLARSSPVRLTLFNLIGQRMQTLLDDRRSPPGHREVSFNANGLPSGIYFYRLEANGLSQTKKMLLLK